jgi:hypothetical protein
LLSKGLDWSTIFGSTVKGTPVRPIEIPSVVSVLIFYSIAPVGHVKSSSSNFLKCCKEVEGEMKTLYVVEK